MLKIIINIWKSLGDIFNDFINFIIENRLTSLLIVAILGLAISSLVSSLKTNIIEYYLNKLFKTSNNNLIMFVTSIIQFIIIIIILYIIYKFLFARIEKFKQSKESFNDISWKNNVLSELKTLNSNLSDHKKN
jgi:large-conductance mechanosensitive channel